MRGGCMSVLPLVALGIRNCVTHELCGAVFALIVAAASEVLHVGKRKPEVGEHGIPGFRITAEAIHWFHGVNSFENGRPVKAAQTVYSDLSDATRREMRPSRGYATTHKIQ